MEFSPGQAKALEDIAEWLEYEADDPASKQVFHVFGYAGAGKTTIIKHSIKNYDGRVLSGAFTGKAAYVMGRAGMPDPRTIHSLTYTFQPPSRSRYLELMKKLKDETDQLLAAEIRREMAEVQQPRFIVNEESDLKNCDLLILDEVSMVGEAMGHDLLSFGTKILVLGDPGQLPPIKDEGFFTRATPEVMLTEIHRQALDNPIISLATTAREGRTLRPGYYGESWVGSRRMFADKDLATADQVLCGTNNSRRELNTRIRSVLGYTDRYPQEGERIICLKNDHGLNLMNGEQFTVLKSEFKEASIYMRLRREAGGEVEVCAHPGFFDEYYERGTLEALNFWDFRDYHQFDFGYAITVHKSQGSQWDNVIVYDDGFGRSDPQLRKRWLYTAITRAAETIKFGI